MNADPKNAADFANLILFGLRQGYLVERSNGVILMDEKSPPRFQRAMARHGVFIQSKKFENNVRIG